MECLTFHGCSSSSRVFKQHRIYLNCCAYCSVNKHDNINTVKTILKSQIIQPPPGTIPLLPFCNTMREQEQGIIGGFCLVGFFWGAQGALETQMQICDIYLMLKKACSSLLVQVKIYYRELTPHLCLIPWQLQFIIRCSPTLSCIFVTLLGTSATED